MTATNTLGIRNGNQIVAYGATTKRTKQVLVTDASHIVISGTNISNSGITRAALIAYADSNNVWRLKYNIHLTLTSGGARVGGTVTFNSPYAVTFKSGVYQSTSVYCGSSGNTAVGVANPNSTLGFNHSSSNESSYFMSGDVELNAEPTWAAANMEGAINAAVYIPAADASTTGLITAGAQTVAGVKTFTNGISLGNETLSTYDEGTWAPVIFSEGGGLNFTQSSAGKYTRIGNVVYVQGKITVTARVGNGSGTYWYIELPVNYTASSGFVMNVGTLGYNATTDIGQIFTAPTTSGADNKILFYGRRFDAAPIPLFSDMLGDAFSMTISGHYIL